MADDVRPTQALIRPHQLHFDVTFECCHHQGAVNFDSQRQAADYTAGHIHYDRREPRPTLAERRLDMLRQARAALIAIGCQGTYCEGPEAEPEDMVTCHRCWILHDIAKAMVL